MVHPPSGVATSHPDVEMSDEAMTAFLQRVGDGVLTVTGESTRSFPVSFAYDAEAGAVVFQLFTAPGSAKRDALERDGIPATLVAYDCPEPDDWTSVIVDGVLVQTTPGDVNQQQYAAQATPVGMSVFDTDPQDLRMEWYELQPTTVSGRQSPR
jgi:nitroimidazol reductase NimA-like FMN-containing flavoprotein (pyridoxamine 5'-phosphate oxidase superfamily)